MTIAFDLLLYLYQTISGASCIYPSPSPAPEKGETGDFQPLALPPGSEIKQVSTYCESSALEETTLYLLSPSFLPDFLEAIQKTWPGQKLRQENLHAILVIDKPFADDGDFPGLESLREKGNLAVIVSPDPPFRLAEALSGILQRLHRWELGFVRGILDNQEADQLFLMLQDFLPLDFAIVDLDMNYIYYTKGYAKSRNLRDSHHTPTELFQDLVSRQRFHQAAREKTPFYYYTDAADTMNLCQNIFIQGHYIARIVAVLPAGHRRLPVGAERFFSLYASYVQDLFAHRNLFPARQTRDQMHRLCHLLLQEETCAPDTLYAILRQYHWAVDDTFLAILLRFHTEPEWNAQLYLVLPYLSAYLEREWSNSCAIYMQNEILLILNLGKNASGQRIHLEAILRKIAYFVRDNICKAGVSPLFEDISQLSQARRAAKAALEMGARKHPHLWYYLFDDLRLDYLTQSMKEAISAPFLRHPALRLLEGYDALHQSELVKTLETYLVSNLNMTLAANRLYIHRTSFCRRMNTIKQLTGLDLTDSDTILTLLLSFRL